MKKAGGFALAPQRLLGGLSSGLGNHTRASRLASQISHKAELKLWMFGADFSGNIRPGLSPKLGPGFGWGLLFLRTRRTMTAGSGVRLL
jgi:hypothetical protein